MTRHAFVDESFQRNYTVAAAVLSAGEVNAARSTIRQLLRPRRVAGHVGGLDVRHYGPDQTSDGGQWVSLGSFGFTRHGGHAITMGTTTGGIVAADEKWRRQ